MSSSSWRMVGRVSAHVLPSRLVLCAGKSGRRFVALAGGKRGTVLPCAFLRLEHSFAAKRASRNTPLEPPPPLASDATFSRCPDVDSSLPRFDSLKGAISDGTLQAITGRPFNLTHMSPVQAEVLPFLPGLSEPYDPDAPQDHAPRDLLVRAKTGTGKTLAFLVPAIEARLRSINAVVKQAVADSGLEPSKGLEERAQKSFTREHVGTLILSPTRELATQIATEALRLCYHHPGMDVRLLTGGIGKGKQMRDWMTRRRDIVVATPGRMQDLLRSEPEVAKGLSKTKLLVLDETDSLLDIGFREVIDDIKKYLPKTPELQTFLFSATVSRNIQQVARSSLDPNHLFINTVTDNATPVHAHIPQYHTVLPNASHQISHLLRLLAHDQLINPTTSKIIVFLPTTKMTQLFTTMLHRLAKTTLPAGKRTNVYEIHSKKDQSFRTRTSDTFRRDRSGAAILVSSDVSARGVDYPGVTRIIQVGIPGSTEQYVHRIGRTGRAGTGGRGDLILLPWEMGFITAQLNEMPLQPLTIGELTTQVQDLAARHDAEPQPSSDKPQISSRFRPGIPQRFISPVADVVKDTEKNVSEVLLTLDEKAVNETFASLLGYYVAKYTELRVEKSAVVQGCKDWAVEACGLPIPPYVSETFLHTLGVTDGPPKRTGRRGYQEPTRGRPWEQQRSRRSFPSWVSESDQGRSDGRRGQQWRRESSEDGYKSPRSNGFQQGYNKKPYERRRNDGKGYTDHFGNEGTGTRDLGNRGRRLQSRYSLDRDDSSSEFR